MKPILLSIALGIAGTQMATAAVFGADSATASSQASGFYDAGNTIDGSGLSVPGQPAATHGTYVRNNHWTSDGSAPLDEFIVWGFGASGGVSLGGIYIWNHRSDNISANDFYEPTLFDLTIFDDTMTVLASYDDVGLTPDTNMSQAFVFEQVFTGVAEIRFDVEETQGSTNYTGLAEVLFDDSNTVQGATQLGVDAPVPLPAAGWMLLAGVGALALGRRKS